MLPIVFVALKALFIFIFFNNFVIVQMQYPEYVNLEKQKMKQRCPEEKQKWQTA
jgi:hypothetical protein